MHLSPTPTRRPSPAMTDVAIRKFAQALALHFPNRVESPWLDAAGAAAYLCCPVSRIRKLTASGDLPCEREGRRVLYDRAELDAFVRSGGGIT